MSDLRAALIALRNEMREVSSGKYIDPETFTLMEAWANKVDALLARVPEGETARHDPFWVLEKTIEGRAAYWDGGHAESYRFDINQAVQFCRKDDAIASCRSQLQTRWGWELREHLYMQPLEDAARRSPAPEQEP